MKLTTPQIDALRALARNGGEKKVGTNPLTTRTITALVNRGLVTTHTKTVVGVTITKAKLTDAGRDWLA